MVSPKISLRRMLIAQRRKISDLEKVEASETITKRLLQINLLKSAVIVCCYISLPDEVDTKNIIIGLQQKKKTIVAPHIAGGALTLRTVESLNTLTAGMFGVLQPRDNTYVVPINSVDIFIVPGLAFDRTGHRLGWGKGYYDRLLRNIHVPVIGLSYAQQVIAQVPHTSYDVSMTHVITEKETIIC